MMAMGEFDVENLSHRRLSKPREIIEAEKVLPPGNEQPKAMRRYIQDFNFGSVFANFDRFPLVVPR
jgi:hypothetical protein